MDEKIIFKEESYRIVGICMEIHSGLGSGFLEAVYSEVLAKEFIKQKIPFEREKKLDIYYNGEKLNKTYRVDFLCFDEIIVEIKSAVFMHDNFSKQLQNYLKATNKKLGILVNFGEKSLNYKRIINL
ncbi:GxxExxY protein [Frigoriflavimonas asaccharolytica]|uniref:GxxExxY protein n=1 Tax=Frigoriflavimonas asaccharolytica TaxID=2735899 RepID=A0A8J8K5D2_9FLAO|nr:GxxExxY protein [Frigoriflavimonas asaccharolytica]NRS92685.1 GxxExxY protein [Frigoriflavimonas asaccharolytica]